MKKMELTIQLVRKWGVVVVVFLLPFMSIVLAGKYKWAGRMVGLSIVIPFSAPAILWYALNPKSIFLRKGAKLHKPELSKVKAHVTLIMRITLVILALILLWGIVVPFASDLIEFVGGQKPVVVRGIVSTVQTPFPLLEFISQEIVLEEKGTTTSYRFFYPLRPELRKGATYELIILPKSRIVLEAKKTAEPKPIDR